jgi:type IV pilus assembly protein PilN
MAHINLLPWREELRKQRKRDFFVVLGSAAFAMVLVVVYAHIYVLGEIEDQDARNDFLQTEIKKVEAQIKEIKELEKKKAELIARMQVIDKLQKDRPGIVHMFDELVRLVPEGMTLTSLKQSGDNIVIEGVAQSNARVSAFMRSLDASDWFAQPSLDVIKASATSGKSQDNGGRTFTLRVKQKHPAEAKDGAK